MWFHRKNLFKSHFNFYRTLRKTYFPVFDSFRTICASPEWFYRILTSLLKPTLPADIQLLSLNLLPATYSFFIPSQMCLYFPVFPNLPCLSVFYPHFLSNHTCFYSGFLLSFPDAFLWYFCIYTRTILCIKSRFIFCTFLYFLKFVHCKGIIPVTEVAMQFYFLVFSNHLL